MKYLCFFILLVLFIGCKNEDKREPAQDIDQINSTASAKDVLEQLKDASIEDGTNLVTEAIRENFDTGLPEKAQDIISNVLYNFDSEEQIKAYGVAFLKEADGKAGVRNFHKAFKSAFVTKYPQDPYSATASNMSTIDELLTNKADLINNPNFNRFSVPDAKEYIEMSEAYALVSPRDEVAGSQLIKAGNTAKSIPGYAAKAVMMYDWLITKQPDHPKAGQALFLKAFTYDNELKKPETAKRLYEEFIAKYPTDDFADDAQLLLQNVGKTDQEFYESIVKKKGEK